MVCTATASGKSLCYNLPVLEGLAADPGATALYLFPTKALAQARAAQAAPPLVLRPRGAPPWSAARHHRRRTSPGS